MTAGDIWDAGDSAAPGSLLVLQAVRGRVVAREAAPTLFKKFRLPCFIDWGDYLQV
jgi:hypothetical protein